jgi:hypothetical protein
MMLRHVPADILAGKFGPSNHLAQALEGLSRIAMEAGNPVRAACLLGAADGRRRSIRRPAPLPERPSHEEHVAAVQNSLEPEAWITAWAAGEALTVEAALEYALEETVT